MRVFLCYYYSRDGVIKNEKKRTSPLAIVGFILSLISSLAGLIVSYIAIKHIAKNNENGHAIAKVGIIISIVKLILIFILIVLLIIGINNLNQSDIDVPFKYSSNIYKCSKAKGCTYNSTEGIYSCIYFNEDDGVEEYITCDNNANNKKANFTTTAKDTSKDDEDYIDTFDYDREDIVSSED